MATRSAGPRRLLLASGWISSLLYLATDLLGGLSYPGYSFTSQMVSELMAVGAPSERIVDPFFVAYGVLVFLFGVGVFREGAGSRWLRFTGALLGAYAVAGFTGPTLFEMYPRGVGAVREDLPHLALTGVLVLLTLLAVGAGAFALGPRFRAYSAATLAALIALGVLMSRYGGAIRNARPTPGLGVLERLNIYASMLWIALLAVALLRRRSERTPSATADTSPI